MVVKRLIGVALGAFVLAVVAACGPSLDEVEPVAGVTEIAVEDDEFEPRVVEVPAGSTMTWTWQGRRPHDVAGDGFRSPVQGEGEFTHTFDEPGSYDYLCNLHGGMTGRIIVTE